MVWPAWLSLFRKISYFEVSPTFASSALQTLTKKYGIIKNIENKFETLLSVVLKL
jgi:hypothetical protein